MALMPAPLTKPAKGLPGQFQNMEEWNAFTAFTDGEVGFGEPVSVSGQAGDGSALVKALADGEVFAGISRENVSTSSEDPTIYADGDRMAVADEGVIFGLAGAALTKGGQVFWDPSAKVYLAAEATGALPLPNCEYDQDAAEDEVVPIRLRVVPGGEAVVAGE